MSHTPEPWSFNDREDIKGNGDTLPLLGISIPMTAGNRQNEAKANARRIVACVNACKLFTTEELEKFPEHVIRSLGGKEKLMTERDTYRDLCGELLLTLKAQQHLNNVGLLNAGAGEFLRVSKLIVDAIIGIESVMGENSNG